MIDRRPAVVARCLGTADVIACVQFAREHRLLLSIKGGGHNIAGLATADGAPMLDLSLMRGLWVDAERKVAHAQAGCLLGDVDRETQVHGLATVLGFISAPRSLAVTNFTARRHIPGNPIAQARMRQPSAYRRRGSLKEITMKKIGFLVAAVLVPLLLNACNGKCDNRMESSFLLSHLDATYTLNIASGCNANFTLAGSVTPKTGATGKVDVFAVVKGADCTVISANGTGSDKIVAAKLANGRCTVKVPFQAASGVLNTFTAVDLKAEVAAKNPDQARCRYTGPAPIVVTAPQVAQKQCQLPF